jgi:choline dehydrogenase-like flavoprotein
MVSGTYDIITVGGGLGGITLAKVMAEHGARVLVLEREKQFKDRIRGELLQAWGVAETQALGLYELLRTTCAFECPRLVPIRLNMATYKYCLPRASRLTFPAGRVWLHAEEKPVRDQTLAARKRDPGESGA